MQQFTKLQAAYKYIVDLIIYIANIYIYIYIALKNVLLPPSQSCFKSQNSNIMDIHVLNAP